MEITNKKYNELMETEMMLDSLYGAGVDNWECMNSLNSYHQ
jgi:hypothetical protein